MERSSFLITYIRLGNIYCFWGFGGCEDNASTFKVETKNKLRIITLRLNILLFFCKTSNLFSKIFATYWNEKLKVSWKFWVIQIILFNFLIFNNKILKLENKFEVVRMESKKVSTHFRRLRLSKDPSAAGYRNSWICIQIYNWIIKLI